MPAASQQQQKIMGLALSVKKGETPRSEASDDVLSIVDSMSEKDLEKYAETEHTGLPKTVEAKIREMVRELYKEMKSVNEYDEWRNTRIQAKNIFRMLKQKYNNNIPKMKDGLEDIIKQNKTKNDQAEVVRGEFNKYFKLKESVNEEKVITKKEWDRIHKDFKGMVNGKPHMMYLDPKTDKTVYGPVTIKESLTEVKFNKGDLVRVIDRPKYVWDKQFWGKSGYIKGVMGKDILVTFPNGRTIVVDAKDIELNKD